MTKLNSQICISCVLLYPHLRYYLLPDPCTSSRDRRDRDSVCQRRHLARVQECQTQESDWEEQAEKEQKSARDAQTGHAVALLDGSSDDEHASAHADSRDHHEFAAAKPVNGQNADGRAACLKAEDGARQDPGDGRGEA